jgi:hypothetical protein
MGDNAAKRNIYVLMFREMRPEEIEIKIISIFRALGARR